MSILHDNSEILSVETPIHTADKPLKRGRLLIFIVAYNAEKTIESVLKRIPLQLSEVYEVEVLIIDDSSQDDTFVKSELARRAGIVPFSMTVLFNPVNQGYGGNQKIGYHYAIKNQFDWVALVHGDGQYAPECLPELVGVLAQKEADAVFGSRMMQGNSALKGGMPFYKFIGNKTLTRFQNFLLKSNLSEFHSGYRLYSTEALAQIPFDLNSNDFHFDTEIIIQFMIAQRTIKELPIPTFYGDEICHVNGMKYAWDVACATLQAKVQKFHILYDRKFDCSPQKDSQHLSLEPHSAESKFLADVPANANILILGKVSAGFLTHLTTKGYRVTVASEGLLSPTFELPQDVDHLLIFDDIEISRQPDLFVQKLRNICRFKPNVVIVLAVGNIGFCLTRLLLLFGRFSYTRRGIISLGHLHFFTLRALKKLFSQNWFECVGISGLPIMYNRVFQSTITANFCSAIHRGLIRIRPSLFSYQLFISVRPRPSLDYLLEKAVRFSENKSKTLLKTEENPGC
ncbi:MAG: glycosyltransferase family 2 protein [Proteobacteria bacterium]|nr:glycosyltransferase family 2 protein [Pseudomonadota bacterium]